MTGLCNRTCWRLGGPAMGAFLKLGTRFFVLEKPRPVANHGCQHVGQIARLLGQMRAYAGAHSAVRREPNEVRRA